MQFWKRACRAAGLAAALLLVAAGVACRGTVPTPTPAPTVPAPTGPAATPVAVTRIVERTVVVTPAPTPTPFYVSRITAPPGVLVYPLSADPATLDPQIAAGENEALVVAQLYEGLFDLRPDGSLSPAAAAGYDVSPDGRVYTVRLRPGLAWSDGRPVTAQDYAAGACRLLDPATGSSFAYLLSDAAPIAGARGYASGAAAACPAAIQAADSQTLRLTLEQPFPAFPQILAGRAFLPAPPAPVTQGATPATGSPLPPIGNGPYLLAEWAPGNHLTLVKNPKYWDAASVGIERVDLPIVPDAAARLAGFLAGRYHVSDVPPGAASQILADTGPGAELHALPRPGASFLGFNITAGPAANADFRRAVASAIDRRALVRQSLQEPCLRRAAGIVPPGTPGYATIISPTFPYDPQAARAFLAKAGYGPDTPPPALNLWANREGHNAALAQALAGMIEQTGIPVRLTLSNYQTFRHALDKCRSGSASGCDWDLYLAGWVMDYEDPARILGDALGSRPLTQYGGWRSDDYSRLLIEAAGQPDAARRAGLYAQAEKLLLDQAVVVPLFYYDDALLIKQDVKFDFPLSGPPQFRYWSVPEPRP